MNDDGNTRDLRPSAESAGPPDDEIRTRHNGSRDYRAGWLITVCSVIAALITAIITGNGLWHGTDGEFFLMIALVGLIVLGGQLIAAGTHERNLRPLRDRQRENAARSREDIEGNSRLIRQLLAEAHDRYDASRVRYEEMLAYMAAVPGRLVEIEERLTVLVSVLPDEIQKRYWAGFNDAVRKGFQATGTDGDKKSRPPYIGLVPREETDTDQP